MDTYPDPDLAIQQLINLANEAGGHDNCTVAIAIVSEPDGSGYVNEVTETIPESTPEEAQLELDYLDVLGVGVRRQPTPSSDVDTNPIRVVPSAPNAPKNDSVEEKTIPPGRDKKRKGGFWPWSNG